MQHAAAVLGLHISYTQVTSASNWIEDTFSSLPASALSTSSDRSSNVALLPQHSASCCESARCICRAVVERHRDAARLPAIQVRICEADSDMTFR